MPETQQNSWICAVCGYIHFGAEPLDICPVCGADRSHFEAYTEPGPPPEKAPAAEWRCLICEYIHTGQSPPENCPVCGASPDQFEPHAQEPGGAGARPDSSGKFIIAGAGIAGVSAAEAIRRITPHAEIILLSRESDIPYYRLNLTHYIAGEITADALALHSPEWYSEHGIEILLDTELLSISPGERSIAVSGGKRYDFDKLILASGAHPFIPPIPGAQRENVTVLRTRRHAEEIIDACHEGMQCVCIGGGILGMETAGALAKRGVKTTILEGYGWLLPRQLSRTAATLLETHAASLGISLMKKVQIRELQGDERVHEVLLQDGAAVPADYVIIAAGVRSNSSLARMAGLAVRQGVIVDNTMATSHPGIYAAGDIAEHRGVTYGLWGPAQYQGTIAGMNAAGEEAEFAGIPRTNVLKVLGYDMFSIGQVTAEDGSFASIEEENDGRYVRFLFRDNRLVGSILMGDTSLSTAVKKLIENRQDCSAILKGKPDVKTHDGFSQEVITLRIFSRSPLPSCAAALRAASPEPG